MFWVDTIADEIEKAFPKKKKLLIRDEKTASGKVHIGSLRGVVIHGVIAQALRERSLDATFVYEINDNDPMDGLPVYVDRAAFLPHMGKPLKDVPCPDPTSSAKNYAEQYGQEFVDVIHKLGFDAKIVWAAQDYKDGKYDGWIKKALEHPKEIRAVYKKVSGSEKGEEWNPVQVVCEKCGKVGTTTVTDWDGANVTYACEPDKVTWAKGCGHTGTVAPTKGRGKLPWKVEWAAKWEVYNVDIEGSGKDHNASGGSHEVAETIARDVFKSRVPFNIPYEFFLFGGAKMSASKGLGASAKEVADLLPPEILRFLMTRPWPHQPIEFTADGENIPRLYDRHDQAAELYLKNPSDTSDDARAFYYSQVSKDGLKPHFLPRFSRVAFLLQIPHLDFWQEMEKMKGGTLTPFEKKEADERRKLAEIWLKNYAPESYKFAVQKEMPDTAYDLTPAQKSWLVKLADLIEQKQWEGEKLHNQIHELRQQENIPPRDAFAAIYMTLLGKTSGPQAGWFIEALQKLFVTNRFRAATQLGKRQKKIIPALTSKYLAIPQAVREQFPDLLFATAVIKGVRVQKSSPELEAYKADVIARHDWSARKKEDPGLQEWKKVYRRFGVDPTKKKPSPVALIDRLAAGKGFPIVNTVVDTYNLIVVDHGCSNGAFDMTTLQFPVTLRLSKHGEPFRGLGEEKEKPIGEGELIYVDAKGRIFVCDLNYRDAEETRAREGSADLFFLLEGNAAHDRATLQKALDDTCRLIPRFCGGTVMHAELFDRP